jgi:hypothetical protein
VRQLLELMAPFMVQIEVARELLKNYFVLKVQISFDVCESIT